MADPSNGTPVGGRRAVEETLREGVPVTNTEREVVTGGQTSVRVGTSQRSQPYKSQIALNALSWEDNGSAIIDGSSLDGTAGFPTLLYAANVLDSPLDDWYCFWATHDQGYIALSTAPSPWGPWTYQTKVLTLSDATSTTELSSPSSVYDPANNRVNLYFHGGGGGTGQKTWLATAPDSGDATNFTEQTRVLDTTLNGRWDESEKAYLRVVRDSTGYIGVYQGRDDNQNAHAIGVAYSADGENWTTETTPAYDNTQWQTDNPRDRVMGRPTLSQVGGTLTVIYTEGGTQQARALPFSARNEAVNNPGDVVFTAPSWDSSKDPAVGEFVTDGEYLYLLYHVDGTVAGGSDSIGVARVGMEAVR